MVAGVSSNSASAVVGDIAERVLVPCPATAAVWFVDARAAIVKVPLGCHFDALIAVWTRIEYASRFEHSDTNLPTKSRPTEVAAWVQGGRGKRAPPVITDAIAYGARWQIWWDTLQPEWRKKDGTGVWCMSGGYGGGGQEWGPLYRWGVNGTLPLLASLYFWGLSTRDSDSVAWERAVCDVTWMLEGMAVYYEKFNRRF